MDRRTSVRHWATALVGLLILFGAPSVVAAWPAAQPAQPLVQAPLRCAPGIVPISRRCKVIDYAGLGDFDGRSWYYTFYATHWADRHGHHDRGFPIVFFLEKPATLRLSLWVDDAPGLSGRWAMTAPARPTIIPRPNGVFLGMTLKAVQGPDDQRLFRLTGIRWKIILIDHRSDADQARLDAATPAACSQMSSWAFDWRAFTLRMPLKTDLGGGDCGTLVADVDVRNDKLSLTSVRLVR